MTGGLGLLVGGASVGYLVGRFGYGTAFGGLAAFETLIIVGGLLAVEPPPRQAEGPDRRSGRRPIGGALVLLFLAQVLMTVASGPVTPGRPLAMKAAGFSSPTIGLTVSLTGLASLGLPPLMGWLSDRLNRRWILMGSCAVTAISLVVLGISRSLWQFMLFAVLTAFSGLLQGLGPSLVVDLDPAGDVARNISLFGSMAWIGNVCALAAAGFAFDALGMVTTMLFAALIAMATVVPLAFVSRGGGRRHC